MGQSQLGQRIDHFFSTDVSKFTTTLAEIEKQIDPNATPAKDGLLEQINAAYGEINAACEALEVEIGDDETTLKETQARYRELIAPWMDRSNFMLNAKTKPRGYPGDFEMLESIYDARTPSKGIGGYLCLQGYGTTLGRGVVARMHRALEFLTDEFYARAGEPIHVMNVACGPCRELFEPGFKVAKDYDVRITLVDQEQDAMNFVMKKVNALGADGFPPIKCIQHNALRMRSADANVEKFGRADVLYSVGLCDYLPDRVLIPMLAGWRKTLAPGGSMYVAFKDQTKYDKTVYQWMTDWYFLQRTTEECRQLFVSAGFSENEITMSRDSDTESIITFCGTMPARTIRIDAPEKSGAPAFTKTREPRRR